MVKLLYTTLRSCVVLQFKEHIAPMYHFDLHELDSLLIYVDYNISNALLTVYD